MKLGILLAMLVALSACGMQQVDEGFRGIKTHWGKVVGEPLMPDMHFYNPIADSIIELEVREQAIKNKTQCFTKDTQTVSVEYVVTYFPDPAKIGEIYKQFGKNWEEKIIIPALEGSIKDAIGGYIADDLVSKREAVKIAAQKEIIEALQTRNVKVTRLDLVNLDFEPAFEHAVEAKVVAIQKALEAKNKTVQIAEQAKQKVLDAEAEAKSMRIRSQALEQNKALVEYEAVQKWNGELPQIIMGNGATPFIDMRSLGKGK